MDEQEVFTGQGKGDLHISATSQCFKPLAGQEPVAEKRHHARPGHSVGTDLPLGSPDSGEARGYHELEKVAGSYALSSRKPARSAERGRSQDRAGGTECMYADQSVFKATAIGRTGPPVKPRASARATNKGECQRGRGTRRSSVTTQWTIWIVGESATV